MVENPACGFQAETAPSPPAACAILGFGYLGRISTAAASLH